ncbi:MFS transporter [Paenibacillus radicis (ex Gao et al. 2016)]|uniref:MFS transporter n=1 Tax=Paenibacillus radicis (ex Gao et al. 2016) TaxID=1737354 RepID=A0A917H2F0_9BACL|nr:MFS transporter [Paenibacillus radicis (ex Gao et al. 2016)]GGG65099.1 MFS transporter [Paenibacillus radicis (ex Gao et al. 2016)]
MTEQSIEGNNKSLAVLKRFNFFLYGTIAILTSFFPLYFQEIGLSKIEIGMIMAGGPFISIFANPFWGYWSDRTQNVKRILILLLIGNLIATVIVFQTRSYVLIFALMLIFFFFNSPTFSQSNSLILNAIENTKHKFGAFRLWGSLGWAIIAVLAGPVLSWMGLLNLWVLYGAMMVVTLLFTIGLPRGRVTTKPKGERQSYWKVMISSKVFFVFVILGVLISVPNSINQTFVSLYISNLGGSNELIGWSVFLSAVFEIPVFLLFDRFLKKSTKMMLGCLVLISILFVIRWLLMSVVGGPIHIIFIQILHCITFGGYYYVGTSLSAHLIPGEYRATGQAIYALTWGGISGIVAGLFGGWMFDNLGPQMMYQICAAISVAGVIGFLFMWLRMRKQPQLT